MVVVSIIVPVYNAGKYLKKCLDSIINQTYEHIEIILINDGSTDNSLDIINQYLEIDKRIILIDKKNEGVSKSRNLGLSIANGSYVTFVDSDDFIELTMIEKLVFSIEDNKSDFSICEHKIIGKKRGFTDSLRLNKMTVAPSIEFLKSIITTSSERIWGYSFRVLYSKRIIDDYNLNFDEKKTVAEDIQFLCTYISYCNLGSVVNEKLYIYRNHTESVTNKYMPNDFENRQSVDDWFWDTFVKNDTSFLPGYYQCKANTYHGYISNLSVGFSILEIVRKIPEIYRVKHKNEYGEYIGKSLSQWNSLSMNHKISYLLFFLNLEIPYVIIYKLYRQLRNNL